MPNDTLTFDDVNESFERETEKHRENLQAEQRTNPAALYVKSMKDLRSEVQTKPSTADVADKPQRRERGVYEHPKGSDIWWVRHADASGKIRREKAGTKGMAISLYHKRKTEALQRKKLPETLRRRETLVSELLANAAEHIRDRYRGQRLGSDGQDYRHAALKAALGSRPAESLTPQEIERALSRLAEERKWKPASFNRHKSFLSLAYRLGIKNSKVTSNPIRLVDGRHEDNDRIRWLSAHEEAKLRAVLQADYSDELPAFDVALHTGMRRSEQYGLTWDCVDLGRRQITIPRSKNGGIRYIPIDETAVAALLALRSRSGGTGPVMVSARSGHGYLAGHPLKTPREWFDAACRRAGIADFTWHCLRHSFASRLVMAGVGLRTVQELMGHKTIAMTCRYAHLAPQHQLDAVCRLDGWGLKPRTSTDTKTDTGSFQESVGAPVESAQLTLQ